MTIEVDPDTFSNKLGKFRISNYLLHNKPNIVLKILDDMMVVEATQRFTHDAIEYIGAHPDFLPIDNGMEPPEYYPIIQKDENSNISNIKFVHEDQYEGIHQQKIPGDIEIELSEEDKKMIKLGDMIIEGDKE
jgi:hypothetical protein